LFAFQQKGSGSKNRRDSKDGKIKSAVGVVAKHSADGDGIWPDAPSGISKYIVHANLGSDKTVTKGLSKDLSVFQPFLKFYPIAVVQFSAYASISLVTTCLFTVQQTAASIFRSKHLQ
jgi:hypothetical protein